MIGGFLMNLVCPRCNHKWNFRGTGGQQKRIQCPGCTNFFYLSALPLETAGKIAVTAGRTIQDDFMQGSLIDALKKNGLDPMKNGQIRDAISSILCKDEYKIAFADAVEKTKLSPIKLTKKILIEWLKKEEYV